VICVLNQQKQANKVEEHMKTILAKSNKSKIDPRILRTHRLLLDSFNDLIADFKDIRTVTIQSITEHAGVNRATFYAHFVDKYELLEVWKRDIFQQALQNKLQDGQKLSIEQVIDTVLDFAIYYKKYIRRSNKEFEPLFQVALQQEIKTSLVQILERDLSEMPPNELDAIATFLSWAIFGSANSWIQNPNDLSKEQIAEQTMKLVEKIYK
jgi:AcrR family transcriptional regulator